MPENNFYQGYCISKNTFYICSRFRENDLNIKLEIFSETVAGFKQMFLYLQPLLQQSSFTEIRKKSCTD